ncbi:competence protein CoiA [Bacillus sp. B-jedd]|uniref:competence protein CoiA n=1 Tax=Bacillus sp. B-jedd TaxID=1476857 RepID=UPI0005156554|nr:competence protein CoiA family protein [Bacillus sp. B-jedd]CEG26114.1 competence protein CoiA [Bacillus sp. B-jedd]
MLTANTKNGGRICLANGYSRATLEYWREHEEFFCPMCGGKLRIKLGEKRIFHFSHLSHACEESNFERESDYHLAGKGGLYRWLFRQNIPVAAERYDPHIRQRPDITFHYENRLYALEFQCSTIPDNILIKRTENYVNAGYIPIWILGGSRLPSISGNTITLSGFDYLFLRSSSRNPGFIQAYCPDSGRISLIQNILPYSPSKAFASIQSFPLRKLQLNQLLCPVPAGRLSLFQWKKRLERSKLAIGANPRSPHQLFLEELYKAGLNIFLLPAEIGLPCYNAAAIATFPVIWQMYIYLDLLGKALPGDVITAEEAAACLFRRAERGQLIFRKLPLAKEISEESAAAEYLAMLSSFGLLKRKGEGTFILQKGFTFPKSNAEQFVLSEAFYGKYR